MSQCNDFSGMMYGKVGMTDMDGFADYKDKLFMFVEAKYGGCEIPMGQRIALERLVRATSSPRRASIAIEIAHNTSGDIDFAGCEVVRYYWKGKWCDFSGMTLREFTDKLLAKYAPEVMYQ